jgi:hypothetical protein
MADVKRETQDVNVFDSHVLRLPYLIKSIFFDAAPLAVSIR